MAACLDARYLGVGDFVQNLGRGHDDIAAETPGRHLRVPKTRATWAKALQSAVERSACGGPVLARPECGMIFGLWA